jgi:hypothetical protein
MSDFMRIVADEPLGQGAEPVPAPNSMVINGRVIHVTERVCQVTGEAHPVWYEGRFRDRRVQEPSLTLESSCWSTSWISPAGRFSRLVAELQPSHEPSYAPDLTHALFSLGTVQATRGYLAIGLTSAELSDLLTRHVSGDAGLLGDTAGAEPTPEDRFCPPLAVPAVANFLALSAGSGLVQGRYSVYRPGIGRRPEDEVIVATLLANGHAFTIIYTNNRDVVSLIPP